ncbi:hypothetical protein AMATHDRAFT_11208 [Amanita thiersii Skay4041]|uniref:Uncharacterized protein n=1 Tax=Amanita thiersii Skay4041 TaxID=703135 RepID=A0A2A9N5S9_9AGAR|nr:hypothetical protein AMATHDRAFT_11208 [Amanita thiersii Skay4041]
MQPPDTHSNGHAPNNNNNNNGTSWVRGRERERERKKSSPSSSSSTTTGTSVQFSLSLSSSAASSRSSSPVPAPPSHLHPYKQYYSHHPTHLNHTVINGNGNADAGTNADYLDEKLAALTSTCTTSPGRGPVNMYEATLSPWRAAIRRVLVKQVEKESKVIAKMQVRFRCSLGLIFEM